MSIRKTAERFYLSPNTVFKWNKGLIPRSKKTYQARKLDMEGLKEDVHKHPDLYQYERAEKFNVSQNCIHKGLKDWAYHIKKAFKHPRRQTKKSVCYFKIKLKNINQKIGFYPISMKVVLHLICRENMATQKWEKDVMAITTGMQKEEKM